MLKIKTVAKSPDQKALGLAAHPKLKPDEVFLMVFDPPRMVSIWNKNVSYDIDIAFVDENSVVFQKESLKADDGESQTPLVFSRMPAAWVLETKKGSLNKIQIGDNVNQITNGSSKNKMRVPQDQHRRRGENGQEDESNNF